jgi:hypothetical protein
MKRNHWKIGLLTACLANAGAFASAQNCDSHTKPCSCQSQKQCDNVGLMSLLNDAASSFEDRLARMIPDLPEKGKQSCGCAKCNSAGASQPRLAPPVIHESDSSPPMPPVPKTMEELVPAPQAPARVRTPELVPVPDQHVDPFKDENARRVRPVPARPATFKRPETTYGQNFDPQASRQAVQLSTSVAEAPSQPNRRLDLALETSSRKPLNSSLRSIRLQTEPTPAPVLNASAVVTASATAESKGAAQPSPAPVAPAKIVGQGRPIVEPAYYNPLRNP